MRCLVVGGTGFLGGAIVDALAAGPHEVVVLARGQTERALPDAVERIAADRYSDLAVLQGEHFDWAFDTSAFEPDAVHRLLDVLPRRLRRYVLISSISAYGTFRTPGLREDDPVPDATEEDHAVARSVPPDERASAFAYGSSYGPLKRACEAAAIERLGPAATALRVGLLVGAGDYTDRLTWWVRRIDEAHGERRRVPAPGPPSRPVQMIDVRDVAEFAVRCGVHGMAGIWNVTGRPFPISELLARIRAVAGSDAEFAWVPGPAISAAGVTPWTDMPLMAPGDPNFAFFLQIAVERAHGFGLTTRPLDETLVRLLEWDRARRDTPLEGGLSEQQEARLLGSRT